MRQINAFQYEPPPGYRPEESMESLRGPTLGGFSPSFIIQSKRARLGASLEDLATEAIVDLNQSLGAGMKNMSKAEFSFDDKSSGVLIAFNLQTKTGSFRQYFVLRVHGDRLCTITVTVPSTAFDEKAATSLLASIASLTLA